MAADFSRQSDELPPLNRPPSLSMNTTTSPTTENGAGHSLTNNGAGAAGAPSAAAPEVSKEVQDVLGSDIGVSTMLNRLKQSIVSAKEFAQFLKKRAILEDEHAKGMRKICKMTQDSIHHMDHRQGSFALAYEEMLHLHDRMADNGQQFAASLHQMHDDLQELATITDKHRKGWKQNGLAAEQRLADTEAAMRKSKSKYDSLAEDYDRVKTGESRQGGKMFGLKGPKSAAQQEEDLLRKVQAADTDYMGKVQTYQSEKAQMISATRPEAIKALQDLIRECDTATTLQMQKFANNSPASFNEKLLLSNGLVISPLRNQQASQSRSLKEVIQAVDNGKDLEDYITSFYSKLPPRQAEPKYERHPVLNPQTSMSMANMTQMHQQQNPPPQSQPLPPPPQAQPPISQPSVSSPVGQGNQGYGPQSSMGPPSMGPPSMGAPQSSGPPPGHERSFSHGALLSHPSLSSQHQQQHSQQPPQSHRNSTQALPSSHQRFGNGGSISQAPPQLGALPFQSSQNRSPSPPTQSGPYQEPLSVRSVSPPSTVGVGGPAAGAPSLGGRSKQVFGVTLNNLYERDGTAVAMVVHQCIQAVDLYGLALEGIYRLSGSATHIQKLKGMFDTDSSSHNLDFRNPENFFHDVNSVAGLLKQFFRDLPDPLLTSARYSDFIEAAKQEDDIVRRDSMHAIINELPDPNYATLRAITLHLHRVMENSAVNRMNSQNLAIVFGPTLMGTAISGNIADSGWQVRVVDTILQNTYQIFDED